MKFPISQPKHMLLVLKRTVLLSILSIQTNVYMMDKKIFTSFHSKLLYILYLDLCRGISTVEGHLLAFEFSQS